MHQSMRDDAARTIEHEMILSRAAYQAGWDDCLTAIENGHHLARQSVAHIMADVGWDGAEAAHRRSVVRFHTEYRGKDLAA